MAGPRTNPYIGESGGYSGDQIWSTAAFSGCGGGETALCAAARANDTIPIPSTSATIRT